MNLTPETFGAELAAETMPLLFRSMDAAFAPIAVEVMPAQKENEQGSAIDLDEITRKAHDQGMRDALARSEAQIEILVAQERQGVTRALEEFVREKQRYFAGLEKEVVRLSLAIAERVLHREATMDPLLLAGAAHVALEQVNDDSTALLRVAPEQVMAWKETICKEGRSVEVRPDASLCNGECMLETAQGTMELGVRAQLQEIEHGFFELLGRNPAMAV